VATRWARAAALAGDLDSALRIADQVVATDAATDRADAARVAAAALAHRGQLAHSAELYRWSGSAALATVGLVGTGRLAEVPPDVEPAQPPTLLTAAAALMAQGVRESVTGSQTTALAALVRAADLLLPAGRTALLPDSPAALAALVALHAGEWSVVGSVLDRAVAAGVGGGLMATRHRLLRAWALLVRGDLSAVRELRAAFGHPPAEPRDWLFWVAVELGLARRDGDLAALRHTWASAGEAVLRHPVDLFTLLPLGEFAICAARLGDHERMAPHLADAYALLGRLDGPALWSAPLRWSALQAAIIAEQPAAAREHAAALAGTAAAGGYVRALSGAAECWVEVLAGTVDAPKVDRAARGLYEAGLRWDGSRLAAQAAVRTADRKAMVALLDCARTLQGRPGGRRPGTTDPPGPGTDADAADLSDRERQVARLVVAGLTYKQIADRLYISPKTIEHHVARMRRRLGCESRADLLAKLRHLDAGAHRIPG
jgi:DNA-binding CsgD family transcriptional regulator